MAGKAGGGVWNKTQEACPVRVVGAMVEQPGLSWGPRLSLRAMWCPGQPGGIGNGVRRQLEDLLRAQSRCEAFTNGVTWGPGGMLGGCTRRKALLWTPRVSLGERTRPVCLSALLCFPHDVLFSVQLTGLALFSKLESRMCYCLFYF